MGKGKPASVADKEPVGGWLAGWLAVFFSSFFFFPFLLHTHPPQRTPSTLVHAWQTRALGGRGGGVNSCSSSSSSMPTLPGPAL